MDFATYFKFTASLAVVLAIFGLAAWATKRYLPTLRTGTRPGRRLSIVEVTMLDTRRRLVLVRRDDVEHLILLGQTSDTVVERDIRPPSTFVQHLAPPGGAVVT